MTTTTRTSRRAALLTGIAATAGLLAGSPAAAQMEVTCPCRALTHGMSTV